MRFCEAMGALSDLSAIAEEYYRSAGARRFVASDHREKVAFV
jgi:hypothetical protein